MEPPNASEKTQDSFVKRHAVASYFLIAFAISWTAALCVAAPHLLRHEALPKLTGILMFQAMLLGPSFTGILLARIVDGKVGLKDLFSRMWRVRVAVQWYAVLLVFPAVILGVLFLLKKVVSASYAPNLFFMGITFGIPAGILEEIGWTGFAFPKMAAKGNALGAAIFLGLLWGIWHIPVVNFLGAAVPHGSAWWPFFLAFTFLMTAVRVLISWVYSNTRSVSLAQLMHVSSTGALVVFSAPGLTGLQEAKWYFLYGVCLWICVGVVVKRFGKGLVRSAAEANSMTVQP
jgi:membrane protease YdiL (CAAX protease family)